MVVEHGNIYVSTRRKRFPRGLPQEARCSITALDGLLSAMLVILRATKRVLRSHSMLIRHHGIVAIVSGLRLWFFASTGPTS